MAKKEGATKNAQEKQEAKVAALYEQLAPLLAHELQTCPRTEKGLCNTAKTKVGANRTETLRVLERMVERGEATMLHGANYTKPVTGTVPMAPRIDPERTKEGIPVAKVKESREFRTLYLMQRQREHTAKQLTPLIKLIEDSWGWKPGEKDLTLKAYELRELNPKLKEYLGIMDGHISEAENQLVIISRAQRKSQGFSTQALTQTWEEFVRVANRSQGVIDAANGLWLQLRPHYEQWLASGAPGGTEANAVEGGG